MKKKQLILYGFIGWYLMFLFITNLLIIKLKTKETDLDALKQVNLNPDNRYVLGYNFCVNHDFC